MNHMGRVILHTGFCICTLTQLTFDIHRADENLVSQPRYLLPNCLKLYLFLELRSMHFYLRLYSCGNIMLNCVMFSVVFSQNFKLI